MFEDVERLRALLEAAAPGATFGRVEVRYVRLTGAGAAGEGEADDAYGVEAVVHWRPLGVPGWISAQIARQATGDAWRSVRDQAYMAEALLELVASDLVRGIQQRAASERWNRNTNGRSQSGKSPI